MHWHPYDTFSEVKIVYYIKRNYTIVDIILTSHKIILTCFGGIYFILCYNNLSKKGIKMKKYLILMILNLSFASIVFGKSDIVIIEPNGDYPLPTCTTFHKKVKKYFAIPYGTKAKVIKWSNSVAKGQKSTFFASMDAFDSSDVLILSGPLKGKKCQVGYAYINLK